MSSAAPKAPGEMAARRPSVLFVCTHSATRSPMARALCEAQFGDAVDARCAGVYPGEKLDPRARATLAEIGVPIGDVEISSIADLEASGGDLCAFDLIIALSDAAYQAVRREARGGAVTLEYWPVDDPTQLGGASYRAAREMLARRISERLGALIEADAGQ
ncbi:MAG: low molecular weight phosphatase family protein [Neomegalonema sp.]|nr:low molecular weight phosphatase family protein [Neomegalonema sp.]